MRYKSFWGSFKGLKQNAKSKNNVLLSVPKLNLLKTKIDSLVTYYLNNIVQASLKSSVFVFFQVWKQNSNISQYSTKQMDCLGKTFLSYGTTLFHFFNAGGNKYQGFVLLFSWKAKTIMYIKVILTLVRLKSVKYNINILSQK